MTAPTNYGTREQMVAEARRRADELKTSQAVYRNSERTEEYIVLGPTDRPVPGSWDLVQVERV